MSKTNSQQKPVDKPHVFSFRKATKGGYRLDTLSFIFKLYLPVLSDRKVQIMSGLQEDLLWYQVIHSFKLKFGYL